MRFTLEIQLGDKDMKTGSDVAAALTRVAENLSRELGSAELSPDTELVHRAMIRVKDRRGNSVGVWDVIESAADDARRRGEHGALTGAAVESVPGVAPNSDGAPMAIPGVYKRARAGQKVRIMTLEVAVPDGCAYEDYFSAILTHAEAVNPGSPLMDWRYVLGAARTVVATGEEGECEIFGV